MLAIPYPHIDPVAITIGPLAIRWYALAYVLGLVFAWWYGRRIARDGPGGKPIMEPRHADDLLFWCTLGVVLGGRIGYVLFYNPMHFLRNPGEILALWQGGMSFHGGLAGVALAVLWVGRRNKLNLLSMGDVAGAVTPVGLFLGRLANFINGELWGRVSDVPWAMVFPTGGPNPRHPSQLYEAFLEGLCLFVFIWILRKRTRAIQRPGELFGWFMIGYGVARIVAEFFREPDRQLGFILGPFTMGQLLSVPLVAIGAWLVVRARRRAAAAA